MYLMHLDLSSNRRYTTDPSPLSPATQTACAAVLNSRASEPYPVLPEIEIFVEKQTSKYILLKMAHQDPYSGSLNIGLCCHSYGKPPVWQWINGTGNAPDSLPFAVRNTQPNCPEWYRQRRDLIDDLIDDLAWYWLNARTKRIK